MSGFQVLALGLFVTLALPTRAAVLFSTNATWAYWKGTSEASSPDPTAWRKVAFGETGWSNGPGPLYYGENYPEGTLLGDMRNTYSSVFMRRKFTVADLSQIGGLKLGARCDDGFIAWINGVEVLRYNMPAGELAYNQFAIGTVTEPIPFTVYDLADTSFLVTGENVVAVHAFNANLTSTDLVIDLSLSSMAPDFVAPAVATVTPTAGTVNSLTQVTVKFTEPVTGVDASDLLINSKPAVSMTGGKSFTHDFKIA